MKNKSTVFVIQDNQQSRFFQGNKMKRAGGGNSGRSSGKDKVYFINMDDAFIQPAHNHPTINIMQPYVHMLRVPDATSFESMHWFSIASRFESEGLCVCGPYAFKSCVQRRTRRGL